MSNRGKSANSVVDRRSKLIRNRNLDWSPMNRGGYEDSVKTADEQRELSANDFDYELPADAIAQRPAERRSAAKLMLLSSQASLA